MGLPSEISALGLGTSVPSYEIERSLRFNDNDSAYLNRTPSTTSNRGIWTTSCWIKLSSIGISTYIWGWGNSSSTGSIYSIIESTGTLLIADANSGEGLLRSVALFRDPSAWYHLIVAMDNTLATAVDRCKIYINGQQITSFTSPIYPVQNKTLLVNTSGQSHSIGRRSDLASAYFDGYIAEFHHIDGQQLTPSSFGEIDPFTNSWIPKRYTGTYGTNGFYLPFSDNTSTTTLGNDESGNGNNWTLNNFSVTAGVGNDSLEDTPTNNYCTLNPLDNFATLIQGNMSCQTSLTGSEYSTTSTIYIGSGKWYCEAVVFGGSTTEIGVGVTSVAVGVGARRFSENSTGISYIGSGLKEIEAARTSYGASYTYNDIIGIALDMDSSQVTFYKNNVSQGIINLINNSPHTFASYLRGGNVGFDFNFGQRPFAYTPPTGFKSLNTSNIPKPLIRNPKTQMNVVTYAGTGASQDISGLDFQPDLVWMKSRSATTDHSLYDSVRGVQNQIESNTTTDETTESTGLTAFNSNGFTIGSLAQINTNAATYVGWCWKKGVTPGFDIVTYTGNGTARTIPHNLGAVPSFIIVKARTTASTDQGWPVYHKSNTTAPETDYLLLNTTAATADLNTLWNDTAPTTSEFTVGTNALVNTNNDTYVAYLFSEVEGFSKFGSYTGNGSTNGPFVWCGFKPKYVLLKRTNSTGSWTCYDTVRRTFNPSIVKLFTNLTNIEDVSGEDIDILSNGFKLRSTAADINASAASYVFVAFAETPFKYSTAG